LIASLESAPAYSVPRLRLSRTADLYALVVGLTDFHWGAYSWAAETGESYNRKIAEARLLTATEKIMERLPGQPEKIILPVGSDFFDVDGNAATTTAGTAQDIDSTPTEILITGCELTRDYIDLLRQVAPVTVVMMAGNHDRVAGLACLLYLAAWYRDESDVEIIQDYRPRVYCEYGNVLIGFSHGDGAKVKDLGAIMASEARSEWGRTQHHVVFGGHLHHTDIKEIGGLTHYQMPSLSGTDRWHAKQGYTTAQPGLSVYLVDRQDGVTGTLFSPVGNEE
jgi:predicted phosphodiesterase